MRTLTLILCVLGSTGAFAQLDSAALRAKAANAYGRLMPYLTNEVLEKEGPDLMKIVATEDGHADTLRLEGVRRIFYALCSQETGGVWDSQEGKQYGPAHNTPVHLQDYFENNKGVKKFPITDFMKPENAYKLIRVANWYCRHYKLNTKEKFVRAWNRGPDGWKEHLKFDNAQDNTKHQKILAESYAHYKMVLKFEKFIIHFEDYAISCVFH